MSRTQQLLSGGFSKNTVSKVKSKSGNRGTGMSGEDTLDNEPDRMESYIKEEYLDEIYNPESAMDAVKSLMTDNKKGAAGNTDFRNLLGGISAASKRDFAKKLLDKYIKQKVESVNKNKIVVSSGKERNGVQINGRTYVIAVKNSDGKFYLQARDFKTGRAKKLGGIINKVLKALKLT